MSTSQSCHPVLPNRRGRLVDGLYQTKNLICTQLKFTGPGLVAAVAYCDPGNWATDLEAGSTFGYAHLCVILLASLMAILLQILATRLGYITNKDLGQHCREKLYDRTRHKLIWRWACLYPLYVICEAGIIFTDLAELLGTAIALKMIIPSLPLWLGVILTSADVFFVLIFFNSYPEVSNQSRRSMHLFEVFVSFLVLIVVSCFVILLCKVKPDWGDVFQGFLPKRAIIANSGLYVAVSIIGATVMPHSLFLGSKVAMVDRLWDSPNLKRKAPSPKLSSSFSSELPHHPDQVHSLSPNHQTNAPPLHPYHLVSGNEDQSFRHSKFHLAHASFDIGISLFALALPVNAAILIVAAAAFYYGGSTGPIQVADLASAFKLLKNRVGESAGYIFAIALLISGQAASITVTLAGQIVSEGFIQWRTRPVIRRLATRLIGIVPSAIVAAVAGPRAVDDLLVGSQVALSLVLPFVVAPLILFTSDKEIMSVTACELIAPESPTQAECTHPKPSGLHPIDGLTESPFLSRAVSFENPFVVKIMAWLIFLLCSIANVYAIIQLIQGRN
ncbi:hypothetical protein O181_004866 [Austropuccinia psidii MF-1]|uniref:Uncharacterized protein n=1 Tax=Austropuccinia psidii MF-1 TaxID=1389203 RepID=A0A9Q3BGC3_9BASI|nr:hypothetical protein [Austropuccinia psidii MF-1]